jgi:hypothetical protein
MNNFGDKLNMASAFIFQNQNDQFLNKNNEWVDGSESQSLLKTLFKDEALNIKAEQSVKNPELRLRIVSCNISDKGHLQFGVTHQESPEIEAMSSNVDAQDVDLVL